MNRRHDDAIEAMLRTQFDGPVPDDGFSEHVMQRLPPRRRRVAWPVWAGMVAGAMGCWLSLVFAPVLHIGWREWVVGKPATPAIMLLLVTAGISLLALWWGVVEADER